jgi:1-phosphofructokinase family hexose kinase
MILSVTLNPSVDQTLFVESLEVGDTNRIQEVQTDVGGKGLNLSRVAAELDAQSVATGFLGGTTEGYIRRVLVEEGIQCDFVHIEGETRTNISVEQKNGGPPTTLNAKGPMISVLQWEIMLATFSRLAQEANWVAICGSMPPGIPDDGYAQLIKIAKEAGTKVLLDADGEAMKLGLEAKPDLIKPNTKEAGRLLGRAVLTESEAEAGTLELHQMLGPDSTVVLSMGGDGAIMSCPDGLFRGISPKVTVLSTVGSGDSMLGAILAMRMRNLGWEESFAFGIAAGAATATTDGSGIAKRTVIESLLKETKVRRIS